MNVGFTLLITLKAHMAHLLPLGMVLNTFCSRGRCIRPRPCTLTLACPQAQKFKEKTILGHVINKGFLLTFCKALFCLLSHLFLCNSSFSLLVTYCSCFLLTFKLY